MVAPAADPAHPAHPFKNAPDGLICPAAEIFDGGAFLQAVGDALADTSDRSKMRSATVALLRDARKTGTATIDAAITAQPFASRRAVRAYAYLTDCLVLGAHHVATQYLHPCPSPTEGEKLALLGVGGYGRAEMAPHSDVDLLFLTPYKITAWAESVIESMLYMLWDLKLKVGHASRTVRDCLRLGREDYTIRTAMLELRYLGGYAPLYDELHDRLQNELFSNTARDFIEAKLTERAERHTKQGGQRYMVEPNVKEGKGGLRDLQSLFWIAKYVHGVDTVADLVKLDAFTQDEIAEFDAAENFLWAVRCHLHLIAGRALDQLTFDRQVEVAARMGYVDKGGRRAVEHFMQDYFRHATHVGELTRIFLTALEASHVKQEPRLTRLFRRRKRAKAGYKIEQNRLDVENEATFLDDPVNILRIFEEALRTGTLLHPNAMRFIKANLHLIDDDLRANKDAQRIFLDLMLKHGNPERALRRMNELGVLAAFVPEFEPILAMMQFNMYHHYTVDEHTIQTISVLAQIEREELRESLPVASRILKAGVNRKVLYVALLLHDIGKGREEDHSILGARIARKVAPRLGLKAEDCETVEWLIRNHLLMSDVAQKRDISDPRTVRDFAKQVKSIARLDLLTVLTVCDIRGVGPGTWNNWKAQLLRTLYSETAAVLENGMEAVNREARMSEAKAALRKALSDWDKTDLRRETTRHYPPYWQGLPTESHAELAKLLHGISDNEIRINLTPDPDRDATQVLFALADHPGIFSRLAGALALVGANIVDARTYTSKDGYATAAFWVQDGDGAPYDAGRLPRLRKMIEGTLKGEVIARQKFADKDKLPKRERGFKFPTQITFDNEGSEIYTIIEVDTRDRPGLLFDLTRTLAASNMYIASAVIATYGAQVVDTFYVKDMFGLKLHADNRQKALEEKLRRAIERGAERAQA
ncbi:protein-PII uridylyltransferase [Actibacterium mucosum KCTC 23349]|uniref:Bifunctional uridylyltransferase/uridylyl-removing enzyme n=1 Tax=Actibacterium mucosum KCTC 23349 TaxID=1454373 RepID=A0A037ZFZ2_9RHOB|nr:protein-PII uridylyltransferase [Actibacterium mucosum KCTC 23349]